MMVASLTHAKKIVAIYLLVTYAEAFVGPTRVYPHTAESSTSRLKAGQEQLVFGTTFSRTTDPLPDEYAVAFLESSVCRDHFLSAGGTRPVQEKECTPELLEFWRQACAECYGTEALPSADDVVVATVSCFQFKGLKLETTVYNGIKRTDNESFHVYSIAEKQKVSGPAPMVWSYNKLTGASKKGGKITLPTTKARSKCSIVRKNGETALNFEGTVQITVDLPQFVAKRMPSKDKMEASHGKSVETAILKDVDSAMEHALGAYQSFSSLASSTA